jgi:hypothetical protein
MNVQYLFEKRDDLAEGILSAGFAVTEMDVDGTRKMVVTCLSMGASCAVDIDSLGVISQLIDGRGSNAFGGALVTRLTAKEIAETSLAVASESGFVPEDIVAVMNLTDGSDAELRQVASTATNTLVLETALAGTFYKNALVVKVGPDLLKLGAGLGFNFQEGVRSQQEAPSAPLFTLADGTGDTIDATITDPEQDSALFFDVFVRKQAARPDRFVPNWQPDAADKTVAQIATAVNLSTYEGGADYVPDGDGGTLASAHVVWVGVCAKSATGQVDVKRSPVDWVKHTLD